MLYTSLNDEQGHFQHLNTHVQNLMAISTVNTTYVSYQPTFEEPTINLLND